MKFKAIIVDLDGTLCNNKHRQKYMTQKPKDWKSFYAGIPQDTLNVWCDTIISFMSQEDLCIIILVSGRPEEYYDETNKWLNKYSIVYDKLFMRKDGDFRDDVTIKKEIYEEHIKPWYEIVFAIDDRQRVVNMWRSLGLTCLQCDKGDF